MLAMKTSLLSEELDQAIDGLIGKIAHGAANKSDMAQYNELTVEAIKQSHFSRKMAAEARRKPAMFTLRGHSKS